MPLLCYILGDIEYLFIYREHILWMYIFMEACAALSGLYMVNIKPFGLRYWVHV